MDAQLKEVRRRFPPDGKGPTRTMCIWVIDGKKRVAESTLENPYNAVVQTFYKLTGKTIQWQRDQTDHTIAVISDVEDLEQGPVFDPDGPDTPVL